MSSFFLASATFVTNCDLLGGIGSDITDALGNISVGGGSSSYTFCGDGTCDSDESQSTCSVDCGVALPNVACGNNICDWQAGETQSSCPNDCAGSVGGGSCGDGICDLAVGENFNCTQDCTTNGYCGDGTCQSNMGENSGWCSDCGTVTTCGDFVCASDGSENGWCNDGPNNTICGGYCGDGICQSNESASWCSDCGATTGYCGDGVCETTGSEDGWCYDNYNTATNQYDLCAVNTAAGWCGDGTCAADSSEDGWCYENGTLCGGTAAFCGDGVCAANGSEDGWCYDNYDVNTGSYLLCGAVTGSDGICSADEIAFATPTGDCTSVTYLYDMIAGGFQTYTLLNNGESIVVEAPVTANQGYTVYWDDACCSGQITTSTADVWVSVYDANGSNLGAFHQDSGYYGFAVTPMTTGNMIIELNANWAAGDVGVQVTSP
jgi:hypothetical protein